jgi:hypothetical protein
MATARQSIPLSFPRIVSAPNSGDSYSEYALLRVAEQSALRRKLASSADDHMGILNEIDRQSLPSTLDTLLLLDAISAVTSESIKKGKLRPGESRLELLTRPVLVFEFRRDKDDYASFVHAPRREHRTERYDANWIITSLFEAFHRASLKDGKGEMQVRRISDEAISRRFRGLTASAPDDFFDKQSTSTATIDRWRKKL